MSRALLRIAGKEFREAGRSRWVLAMAALLAALPLLISMLGLGVRGGLAMQGFARTSASLINLSIYLVPLLGLLLAHGSIVTEGERGTLRLLAVQPIDRRIVVLGKFAGLAALLAVVVAGSFGLSGLFIALRIGAAELGDYVTFVVTAVLLGLAFVAIGLWLSTIARDRAQALAGAISAWFLFAIVLDLVLLAGFIALSKLLVAPDYAPSIDLLHRELAAGHSGNEVQFPWVSGLVLLNPTDLFRLANVLRMPAIREVMALTRSMPGWLESGFTLSAAGLIWIAAPLLAAMRRFQHTDLD